MGKEQKILMRNINWVYGDKTGAVPYIFNQDKTAIKLYSEEFNFDVLRLDRYQTMPKSEQLQTALCTYFQDDFIPLSKIRVYEEGIPQLSQMLRHARYGAYEFQPLSHKDISRMRRQYNKYMAASRQQQEQERRDRAARKEAQDTIRTF